MQRRVYKGIPDRWRRAAWSALIERYRRRHVLDPQIATAEVRERTARNDEELGLSMNVRGLSLREHFSVERSSRHCRTRFRNLRIKLRLRMFRSISTFHAPLATTCCSARAMAKGACQKILKCDLLFFFVDVSVRQRGLFHILHAFSLLCTSCGYVQGMGPIAATLLCYFDVEVSTLDRDRS
jgi:hypothetical protein